ncbi:hypothetical protein PENSTE_c011G07660 [Penicillium steckii]|uniref:Uncharacterized protein n=1 Tax=Penicillium steckii TaxID=303698 RepID=A0A1V6T6B8_9EURO|nr:hypothetical protein PENSTE_c011G07660 [Penicillium steckii]
MRPYRRTGNLTFYGHIQDTTMNMSNPNDPPGIWASVIMRLEWPMARKDSEGIELASDLLMYLSQFRAIREPEFRPIKNPTPDPDRIFIAHDRSDETAWVIRMGTSTKSFNWENDMAVLLSPSGMTVGTVAKSLTPSNGHTLPIYAIPWCTKSAWDYCEITGNLHARGFAPPKC